MRKRNVLEVSKSFWYAGTERVMQTFCVKLNHDIFNVYPASTHASGPRENILKEKGFETFCAFWNIESLLELVSKKNIDVVHIHRSGGYDPWDTIFLTKLRERFPGVAIVETNVFWKYDPTLKNIIDVHLHVSKMTMLKRYAKSSGGYDPEKMTVLPNPIDLEEIESNMPSAEEVSTFRKSLGIKDNEFLIGKIWRPDISKWSDLLLEMFPLLLRKHPDTKFLIRSLPANRESEIRKIGADRFILLPPTISEKEIGLTYLALDAYVHSSKIGESFGMTLLEAGAYGKPVIVNSTPWADNNQVDIIRHGENGFIANSPETFADAVAFLIENPTIRNQMGRNGQNNAKRYSAITVTEKIEVVFDMVAESRKLNRHLISDLEIQKFQTEYPKLCGTDFRKREASEILYDNTVRNGRRLVRRIKDYLDWRKSRLS